MFILYRKSKQKFKSKTNHVEHKILVNYYYQKIFSKINHYFLNDQLEEQMHLKLSKNDIMY